MAEPLSNPFFGKGASKDSGAGKPPIDTTFTVKSSKSTSTGKESSSGGSKFGEKVYSNSFGHPGTGKAPGGAYPFNDAKTGDIPGVKDAGPSLSEQLEQTKLRKELEFEKKKLRDAEKLNKKPGFFKKQYKNIEGFRKHARAKQQLHLETKQNFATFRANIATQKQNVLQSKTVKAEAKLKLLEIKKARRDFLKSQQLERQQKRARPLSDQGVRGKSLLGKVKSPVSGSNPISGPGGFFSGVKRNPQTRQKAPVLKRNAVSPGGFFSGIGSGKQKGRKKGGFFG